jgi:hypothetical protein
VVTNIDLQGRPLERTCLFCSCGMCFISFFIIYYILFICFCCIEELFGKAKNIEVDNIKIYVEEWGMNEWTVFMWHLG